MATIKLFHIQLWITIVSYVIQYTWTHDVIVPAPNVSKEYETRVFETGLPLDKAIDPNVHTFQELVCRSRMFVDNSLLIRYVGYSSRVLVTLPRAFGKSINLDMIQYFYQLEIQEGTLKPNPREETKSYKTFEMGMTYCGGKLKKLKDNFLITDFKNDDFYEQAGSVPVVRLNIGQPRYFGSLKDVCKFLSGEIRRTIAKHSYIMDVSHTNINPKVKNCQNMYEGLTVSLNSDTGDGIAIADVIPQLIDLLYKIFERKVFVIIDEYDAVLNEVFYGSSTVDTTEMNAILKFFASFYGKIVKHNENVERVFMTGILCWRGCNIFSSFARMEFHTLSRGDAINFYGMNPDIVYKLLCNAGINYTYATVVDHYDGYTFGRLSKTFGRPSECIRKFNPYAISCFISQNGIPMEENFWAKTSSTSAMLSHLIKYKNFNEKFLRLITDRVIKLNVHEDIATFTLQDIEKFSHALLKAKAAQKYEWGTMEIAKNVDDFGFHILLATGYLTETDKPVIDFEFQPYWGFEESQSSESKNTSTSIWVRAANQEVLKALAIDYVSIFTGEDDGYAAQMSLRWTLRLKACANALTQVFTDPDPDFKQFARSFEQLIQNFFRITWTIYGDEDKAYANEDMFEKLFATVINCFIYDIGIRRLETQRQFGFYDRRRPDVVCQKYNGELFIFELKYYRGKELNTKAIEYMLENGTTQALGYADWYLFHGTHRYKYNAPGATMVVLLVTEYETRVVLQVSRQKRYSSSYRPTAETYWPNSFIRQRPK